MKVSVLGLGNMGSGLAGNILKGGHDLTVWNRTRSKAQPLVDLGASLGDSIEDAVADAEVVVSTLMDDASILDAVKGSMLETLPKTAVHVCATTISPECSDKLDELHRAHGSTYVAGPIIGRPDAAASGQLVTVLAGDEEAIERAAQVATSYAALDIIKLPGRPSRANVFKLCVNYSAISIIEVMGEAYSLLEKADIDPRMLEAFYHTWFATPILKMYATKLNDRHFDDGGFVMTGGIKDVRLMMSTSDDFGVDFAVAKVIEKKMAKAIDGGLDRFDWSAITEVTRNDSGLDSVLADSADGA